MFRACVSFWLCSVFFFDSFIVYIDYLCFERILLIFGNLSRLLRSISSIWMNYHSYPWQDFYFIYYFYITIPDKLFDKQNIMWRCQISCIMRKPVGIFIKEPMYATLIISEFEYLATWDRRQYCLKFCPTRDLKELETCLQMCISMQH